MVDKIVSKPHESNAIAREDGSNQVSTIYNAFFNDLQDRVNSHGAFEERFFHVEDQKNTGTHGGTFTGGLRVRVLNTILTNEIEGLELINDQVLFPEGSYYIEASAPAYRVDSHRVSIFDTTSNITLLTGSSEIMLPGSGNAQSRSFVCGRIALEETSLIELKHQGEVTVTTNGFGAACNFGEHELYSIFKAWKLI